jgi:radical SAM protein with 4Fe4S-binding SPASM domain
MFLSTKISQQKIFLLQPDYIQNKNNRYLLIWKDIPYWMVIDDEFNQFLHNCNGSQTVEETLSKFSGTNKTNKKLFSEIRHLLSTGILRKTDSEKVPEKTRNHKSIPLENIAVNVTRTCNLRCAFCYNINVLTSNTNNELTCDEIIYFLKATKPFLSKKPSLTLVGGEPLEFPDKVIAIADYAIKHGFNTLVSTNGIKITDEFSRKAKKICLEVQVSIDGHNPEINDIVRGKGSFEKAIQGVKTLVRNRTHTILSLVCYSGNFKYLQNFYEMAYALGVNEARFIPLKKLGGGSVENFQPVSTLNIIRETQRIFRHNEKLQKLTGRDCFTILANTCRVSSKRISCGTGLQTLLLDSEGSLYPCLNTHLESLRIANIREESFNFNDIWKNSPILQNIREMTTVENPGNPCSRCLVHYWCLGGCRGETYANKGVLNAQAVNCADLKESILEMFWILSDNTSWIKQIQRIG